MKRTILYAFLIALCCFVSGGWLIFTMPAHIETEVGSVTSLRTAKDCVPRDQPGSDCVQHLVATVIRTEYLSSGPSGALWVAEARLSNGDTVDEIIGPINAHTRPGETFSAVVYNGSYRYLEGYPPLLQRIGDTSDLYYLAAIYASGPLLMVYGIFIVLYVALNVPGKARQFKPPRYHPAPTPPFTAMAHRTPFAFLMLFGVGVLVSTLSDHNSFYTDTMIWIFPWIFAGIGFVMELLIMWRYLTYREPW